MVFISVEPSYSLWNMNRPLSHSNTSREFSGDSPFPDRWLPLDREARVREKMDAAARLSVFCHPWDGLESCLRETGADCLSLVGYGSLVNAASAAMTVSSSGVRGPRPVVAFGVRRVFNYAMDAARSRYVSSALPEARALLNVRLSGKIEHALNGALLEIGFSDLPALRERESDYDLAPVACLNWGGENRDPFVAWILVCSEHGERGKRRVDNELLPNNDYYSVCREGAESYGPEFLSAWLDSTFLGNGETSVRTWEGATRGVFSRE